MINQLEFFLADRGIYMLALMLMAVGVYGMISCGNYMKKLIAVIILLILFCGCAEEKITMPTATIEQENAAAPFAASSFFSASAAPSEITPSPSSTPLITPSPSPENTIGVYYAGSGENARYLVAIDAGHQQRGIAEKEPNGPGSAVQKAKLSSGTAGKVTRVPEYQLNDPFTLPEGQREQLMTEKEKQEALNKMWRNACINDTYEPGSAFKVITAAAALENGVVREEDSFQCPGYIVVEGRKIRCAKVRGHGTENFVQGTMNSCNPVFVTVGLRMGADTFYQSMKQFGLLNRTGIDVPGEAGTIMHAQDQIGPVELATISFGQSFQITPIQLITTASSLINGGTRITPHIGIRAVRADGQAVHVFAYPKGERILSEQTSETLRYILEQVVAEGSGKNARIEGYRIGGKTATSEKLPRSRKKYISSFLGFAPADDPQVIALITIDEPEGIYYGGTIAAPVIRDLFEVILPYLGVEKRG